MKIYQGTILTREITILTHQRDIYAEALNRVRTRLWAIRDSPCAMDSHDIDKLHEALHIIEDALQDNEGRASNG